MNDTSTPFILRYADPTWLAQSPDALAIIRTALDALSEWDEQDASNLDYTYRVRLAHLLGNHATIEELRELNQHILNVDYHRWEKSLNTLDKPYAARWLAFSDILEDRLAVMKSVIPASIKNRRHVREILEWLQYKKAVPQKQLMNHLNIEEASLSRTLTLLESWELVVRRRINKEKFVSIGHRAYEMLERVDTLAKPTRAELEQKIIHLEQQIQVLLQSWKPEHQENYNKQKLYTWKQPQFNACSVVF
ncbi:MAG: hypothetical protein HQL93_00625 [Magnetococcales bacterium]|nr:hypothetical protein [Magnetococcales bacterium]